MKTLLSFVAMAMLSLVMFSCEGDEDIPLAKLDGTYTGTFQRTIGNESGAISQVTLFFENNTWVGSSETYRYPAICNGTYQITGQIISFTNHCMFTADFDWTLILMGDFEIKQTNAAITLTRIYPDADTQIKDVYTLHFSNIE